MLGDLQKVMDRLERLASNVTIAEVAVNTTLAQASVELRKQLEQIPTHVEGASKRFNDAAIHQNDEFIGVANEVLSKFMLRTNEIKATLVRLESVTGGIKGSSEAQRLAAPASSPIQSAPPVVKPVVRQPMPAALPVRPWWALPVATGAAFLFGLVIAFGGLLWTGLIQLSR